MLRLGAGWLKGIITRQGQARTRHLYDFRVFLDSDDGTRSVKLPSAKYSVDGSSAEGLWALLMRCDGTFANDKEAFEEEDKEEEDKEKEEGAGGGGGNGVPGNEGEESGEGGAGCGGGTGVPGDGSEEEERKEDGGVGGIPIGKR